MKFRPLHDWALIQRLDAEERTRGGIIIPDTAKEKPAEGIVISIGPGRYKTDKKDKKKKTFEPTTLQPGQRIIYAKYMATGIEVDNEEVTLVREEDVLGTIEGTGEIAVKKEYGVRKKPTQAVAVKKKSEITPVRKREKKVAAKKEPVAQKAKAAKKATPKTAKKAVAAKKKTKTKKTANKSGASKRPAHKRTVKAVKKSASKKKAAKKKTVKKKKRR